MAKYNKNRTGLVRAEQTTNAAGGTSFERPQAKQELASLILNSMLKGDSFYESEYDRTRRIREACKSVSDIEFIAKAMIFTRTENNLRSVSHVLANCLAELGAGNPIVRAGIRQAILRPDDMTEIFSLWKMVHQDTMLPNSVRRAFKDALEQKFDAYQLKKYAQPRADVKLKDIVKIAHPRDNQGWFKALIEDRLEQISTVERELSAGGNAGEVVSNLISNKKMGYMAALKNIRNALESGLTDEGLDEWCNLIADKKRVAKSRVLPFRFVDAWESVRNLPIDKFRIKKVKKALDKALVYSVHNLEIVEPGERVAVCVDSSGSMGGFMFRSYKNGMSPWRVAATLGGITIAGLQPENVVAYTFDSNLKSIKSMDSVLDFVDQDTPGGATYCHLPLKDLYLSNTPVDKVFMFTDMQLYQANSSWRSRGNESFDRYWKQYKREVAPNAKLMFWNVEGYPGGTPVSLRDNDVYEMDGFSEKLLNIVPKLWKDKDALIKEIEKIDLKL